MLQQHQAVPTLKELVERLPSARDIPSLTDDQAKEALLESCKLLNATVQVVKQLHHWSLNLNFEATAAVKQSRLNDEIHNQQVQGLTEMLAKICDLNWEPFRAISNRAAEDSETIQMRAWHITDRMPNMSWQRLISKLTRRVKNSVKKLDKLADNYNELSDRIYKASQQYHAASLELSERGGPPPQWYVPWNQRNNPLNFFHLSSRNTGVVALVTADLAKPPELEPAPETLLLLGPPMVEYPDHRYGQLNKLCQSTIVSSVLFWVQWQLNKVIYFYIVFDGFAMGERGAWKHRKNP